MNMKRLHLIILTLAICSLLSPAVAEMKHSISFSVGYVQPNSGDLDHYKSSTDFGISYDYSFNTFFGLMIDGHRYSVKADNCGSDEIECSRVTTMGIEPMLVLQYPINKWTPYLAVGSGLYSNDVKTIRYGYDYIDSDGFGYGFVGKAGVRYQLTNRFFLGGFAKGFTNSQKLDSEDSYGNSTGSSTKNLGGYTANFEIGLDF